MADHLEVSEVCAHDDSEVEVNITFSRSPDMARTYELKIKKRQWTLS